MKKVMKDEKVSRTISVADDVATIHHVTDHKQHGQLAITWRFDFHDVSRDELIKIATRALVIDARPKFKSYKGDLDTIAKEWDNKTFNVKELLTTGKRKLSPGERLQRFLDALPPEEREKALEKYL